MSNELTIFKKKNSPNWFIRGTIHGKEIYESTGIPHRNLKRYCEATREYRDTRLKELREEFVKGSTYNAKFLDAAHNYLKGAGSPRFLDKLIEEIGNAKLRDIDQPYLDEKAQNLYGHCTNETINRQFWTPFIAVWKYNTKGQNPLCKYVEWQRPKRSKKTSRSNKAVPYSDAIKFINALSYPAAKVMFFLFWSGCRPMEAFDLQSDEVNPNQSWIALDETKTDVPRGIPIHRALIPLLTYLKDYNEHIFLNQLGERYSKGQKYNAHGRLLKNSGGQLSYPIHTARKRTGLNITPYNARHTVSTNLIYPGGVHEYIKDEILGHASASSMSKHYTHLPRQPLIEAINTIPFPTGLREDLLDPCKIRAEHERRYGQKHYQTVDERDLQDISFLVSHPPAKGV